MRNGVQLVVLTLMVLVTWSCKTKSALVNTPVPEVLVKGKEGKIDFDINALNEDGLIGQRGGLVSVDYEFCFSKGAENEQAIRQIDPSAKITTEPKGRTLCTDNQSIAIGNTKQPNQKNILLQLSNLEYVRRIRRVYYE